MRVLVTGARAPISADIVRSMASAGHQVHVTDNLRWPVGRFSPGIAGFHRLPAPARNFEAFRLDLIALVGRLGIERIIPTSEEVFWLAQIPELEKMLFAPAMAQLERLHNKHRFAQIAGRLGYGAPVACELTTRYEAEAFVAKYDPANFVLKPCYSRFGNRVLFSPSSADVLNLPFNEPWLAQSRVSGREVCIYSIAAQGQRCLHIAYEPVYRAGPGASIYFRPVHEPQIQVFVEAVLADQHLTGQVSFDVMLTDSGIVALECNPRGVSGVHLAAQAPQELALALAGTKTELNFAPEPRMLAMAFLLYQSGALLRRAGRRDFFKARDALAAAGVPVFGSLLATAELLGLSLFAGSSPLSTSTADIEWNGTR